MGDCFFFSYYKHFYNATGDGMAKNEEEINKINIGVYSRGARAEDRHRHTDMYECSINKGEAGSASFSLAAGSKITHVLCEQCRLRTDSVRDSCKLMSANLLNAK